MSQDYTDIYKRGLSSGMEKGKKIERENMQNAFKAIVNAEADQDEKIDKIAELFNIDKEVLQNGIVRDSKIGDNEQNARDE